MYYNELSACTMLRMSVVCQDNNISLLSGTFILLHTHACTRAGDASLYQSDFPSVSSFFSILNSMFLAILP